jgi:Mce-associated membrane protein
MVIDTETLDSPVDLDIDQCVEDSRNSDAQSRVSDGCAAEPVAEQTDTGTAVGSRWARITAYWLLPSIVMLMAAGAGFLAYRDHSAVAADKARTEAIKAATDSTIVLLTYQPDTADKTLNEARDRLTGTFRDAYTSLIHDVVVPGAKQKHISSVATVPAAATVSASAQHAVVLVFVNQSIIIGTDAPTASTSCVKVGLDNVAGKWLISQFDPI